MTKIKPVEVDLGAVKVHSAKRHEPRDEIGFGGMSRIGTLADKRLLRTAAVKLPKAGLAQNPEVIRRLVEEAQITAQLDHPNIVPVYDLDTEEDGTVFFTMKYIRGKTLTRMLGSKDGQKRKAKDLFDQLQVFLKVCDALSFAHSRGVIHRDLKPDNIMVGEFGEVYLMDWGIAKLKERRRPSNRDGEMPDLKESYHSGHTTDGKVFGTPCYLSPEQAVGDLKAIDERTDVFSLGGILYEILTLSPPYCDDNTMALIARAQIADIVPPHERTGLDLPPRLCRIAMKALSLDPADRHQSVLEIKQDVESFLQSGWQFERHLFPKGELIVREGQPGDEAYIITRGRCEVFKIIDGKEMRLRKLGIGDVFGETAIFTDEIRTASVRATEDTYCLVVTKDHFEQELGMGFWLGLFVKALAERFKEQDARVAALEREMNQADLLIQILKYLNLQGKDTEDGRRQAKWSTLGDVLEVQFNRSAQEIAAALEDNHVVEIKEDDDLVMLKLM